MLQNTNTIIFANISDPYYKASLPSCGKSGYYIKHNNTRKLQ